MKKCQSLKERKFNIIIPKTSNPMPERPEPKNPTKIIIKTIAELPDLHLPIKKLANKKHKNPKNQKINPISLEKLKLIVLNLRLNKNCPKKTQKEKSKNKKINSPSPKKSKYCLKNKYNLFNSKKKMNKLKKKSLNDNCNININDIIFNSENNTKKNIKNNNISLSNTKDLNANENRSNSLKSELKQNNNDGFQFRNKDKKWYNNLEYLTEKYNELILTTENLEKNLINKYLNGTDNIISEIEEPHFLKEDIEINTINVNASLRKHLSIRETTLDSSYHNSHYHTDKLKCKSKGFIVRINNYRKMLKKYRTNFILKPLKDKDKNGILKKNKRKKKLPTFSRSLSKLNSNNNNNDENNITNFNDKSNFNDNEYLNHRSTSYEKEHKDSFCSLNEIKKKHKNNYSCCKFDKDKMEKNQLDRFERRNPSLAIIKETSDNINDKNKDKDKDSINIRKKSAKIIYSINKTRRKINLRESTPKIKNKNINSSEKLLNHTNYKQKNFTFKNKKYFNIKNNISSFDEYIKNLKNNSKNNNKSSIDDYIISSDLGIGSYAKVKLGIHKITKKKYAIKIYDKNLIDDEEKMSTIKNEIFILKQLNNENDNIMKLYDIINTKKYLYLILEYIDGISLLEFIQRKRNRRIEENLCKKIFYQIVKAILYCQNKNICHRDIKLENILILNDNVIKLIDFGFAVKCNKNEYQELFCGTLYYMPPEIVNKEKYIPYYSDIWSLGVLLYAMLFGCFPFKANKEDKLFQLINEGKVIFPNHIEVSDEVKKLLLKIFVIKPNKRISLEDILNDPWLKK
jgi:hypothetical protein